MIIALPFQVTVHGMAGAAARRQNERRQNFNPGEAFFERV